MKRTDTFFTLPVLSLITLSFLLGTSEFIIVGILPEIADGFAVSLTQAGSLVSVFAVTYAGLTPFFAALSGKYNRYWFMLVCFGLFVIANLVSAVAPTYNVFLASRVVTAILSGTLVSVSMTFSESISSPENMSRVIAWIFSGFSVAAVFGVPISTTICHLLGWRAAFFCIFGVSLLLLLIMYSTLPKSAGRQSERVLGQFKIFTNIKIVLGALTILFGAASIYTFYTYLTPILLTELGIPAAFISIILLAYGAAALASNLLSGQIAMKSGINKMPFFYFIQAFVLLILPIVTGNVYTGLAVIFAVGLLMYLINSPSQLHFLKTAERDNPDCTSLASSISPVFFNFGIAMGSACGGLIVDYAGLQYVGLGGAVFAMLACGCCSFLVKISNNDNPAARSGEAGLCQVK